MSAIQPSQDPAVQAFRPHYDASQFRSELWNELKIITARYARAAKHGENSDDSVNAITSILQVLDQVEAYWTFPGRGVCRQLRSTLRKREAVALAHETSRVVRLLESDDFRRRPVQEIIRDDSDDATLDHDASAEYQEDIRREKRPYFEVLVVDNLSPEEEEEVIEGLLRMRRSEDEFIYNVTVVPSCEDALIAVLFNHNIQSCLLRYGFPVESRTKLSELRRYLEQVDQEFLDAMDVTDPSVPLAAALRDLRPEVDLFLVTDDPIETVAGRSGGVFRRIFYRQEDYLELHLSILKGIYERYDTPFFTALKEYSQKPTGVFHALPISRAKSITKSHWIQDMGEFYGRNVFLAETSATTGGLDSLLQPTGPIRQAQEKTARAYGSRRSYFVTNGTSTANKIVMQALVRPGDIVLVSRDCHKSHHYALVLAGGYPVYMDPYPLPEYSIYGAVPLAEIKRNLFRLKQAGKLDRVRMLLLTNCTFDGIVYDPERVMREVLAIKPDIIFVWDEAWFAFGRFTPTYRRRTAMRSTDRLRTAIRGDAYRARYQKWKTEFAALDPNAETTWVDRELLPDPDLARLRAYATQSTHKTLTALRQGSNIHVNDEEFKRDAHDAFDEAYMTHTSTSPNYQILASLDVGRRQVELEGYELVRKAVDMSMVLRRRIEESQQLKRYFRLLRIGDLIPQNFRPSGAMQFFSPETGYRGMDDSYRKDEFALDPQRVTVHVGRTGIDGDTFRKMLMDRFDIQINKTSRNTVLFMLNIGTTRGAIAYLIEVLTKVAEELDRRAEESSDLDARIQADRVDSLTNRLPPLPNFSRFHKMFRLPSDPETPEGDLRKAFYLAYDEKNCEHLKMDGTIAGAMEKGREVVSASFVTPYPPGFPILVPGQVISSGILEYLKALDVKEIHGYQPEYGLQVFREEALEPADE